MSSKEGHARDIRYGGLARDKATKALIMIHGRGGSAEDIMSLSSHLHVTDYALFAPQATNHTWYPFPFIAPPHQNEPWLSSSLSLLESLVEELIGIGLGTDQIYFTGFSQGACLTLEFVARNAVKYGGVAAFTGGLIGDRLYPENYKGDFIGTPIFIGSSNPDHHIPVERVYESAKFLRSMNANVTEVLYENIGHTIVSQEIDMANKLIFDI
jgi:phospholipase/carboxylesterase